MRLIIVLFILMLTDGMYSSGGAADSAGDMSQHSENVVTGTLEELDLKKLKGRLKTDVGKPSYFQVCKPDLFERLRVGQQVTVQLDQEGRATKVIDTPVPELKQPMKVPE
jgi:hypothetical protein